MKIIGHRGARGLAPENTHASIAKALEHGVWMIEFDVRVSRDGVPVLHHNPWLIKDSKFLLINRHTYKELLAIEPALLTLEQALVQIGDNTNICAEVKAGIDPNPISLFLRKYLQTRSSDNLYLGSKSQKVLANLHAALPGVAVIIIEPWSGIRATYRARKLRTKYISMNQRWLWSGFIRAMVRSGYHLMTYTLNDPVKARRWQKLGLYGVVTDYPDRFN